MIFFFNGSATADRTRAVENVPTCVLELCTVFVAKNIFLENVPRDILIV